ncbi:MAG: hypothetical protein Q4A24_08280 [Akkermansia sp.]|nr:hypothetical protein [Akkermansia sp.]
MTYDAFEIGVTDVIPDYAISRMKAMNKKNINTIKTSPQRVNTSIQKSGEEINKAIEYNPYNVIRTHPIFGI